MQMMLLLMQTDLYQVYRLMHLVVKDQLMIEELNQILQVMETGLTSTISTSNTATASYQELQWQVQMLQGRYYWFNNIIKM